MSETQDTESLATAPGQILKRARENKNLTVAAIATLLNLDLRTIEALERGDQSKLPAPIFVRGYLRGYARLVGVSETAVLDAYQAQAPQEPLPRAVGLSKVPVRPAFRAPAVPWRGVLLVIVALVVGWLGIQWGPQLIARLSGDAPQETTVGEAGEPVPPATSEQALPAAGAVMELPAVVAPPAVSPEAASPGAPAPDAAPESQSPTAQVSASSATEPATTPADRVELPLPEPRPAPAAESAPLTAESEPASLPADSDFGARTSTPPQPATPAEPAASPAPGPASGEVRLDLRVTDDSWVEVRAADGSKLLLDLLHKGETRSVTGKAPLAVLFGNAAGVELQVDGKPFDHRRYDRDNIARFEIGRKP